MYTVVTCEQIPALAGKTVEQARAILQAERNKVCYSFMYVGLLAFFDHLYWHKQTKAAVEMTVGFLHAEVRGVFRF